MKPTKKHTAPKSAKRKRRPSFDDFPDEVKKALENMKVSYTVETVGEWIHPDVKKRLEEERNKHQE